MAIKDFREYVFKVRDQYIEAKNDLKDFEEALQAGYITEDKLADIKEEFITIDTNYQRLLYVEYLLDLPAKKAKKKKFKEANAQLDCTLQNNSMTAVIDENTSAIKLIREKMEELSKTAGEN